MMIKRAEFYYQKISSRLIIKFKTIISEGIIIVLIGQQFTMDELRNNNNKPIFSSFVNYNLV